jgi:hypothetical protein
MKIRIRSTLRTLRFRYDLAFGPFTVTSAASFKGMMYLIGVMWCKISSGMARRSKSEIETSTRTSVTLPSSVYVSLEIIARKKKVSMAWVMRDAAEKYVAEQGPLFAGAGNER